MECVVDVLPIDVLKIILHSIDTISDSLNILLVCKKWKDILTLCQSHWEKLSLAFWEEYKSKNEEYFPRAWHRLEEAQVLSSEIQI
jgi:hypothetical protein